MCSVTLLLFSRCSCVSSPMLTDCSQWWCKFVLSMVIRGFWFFTSSQNTWSYPFKFSSRSCEIVALCFICISCTAMNLSFIPYIYWSLFVNIVSICLFSLQIAHGMDRGSLMGVAWQHGLWLSVIIQNFSVKFSQIDRTFSFMTGGFSVFVLKTGLTSRFKNIYVYVSYFCS